MRRRHVWSETRRRESPRILVREKGKINENGYKIRGNKTLSATSVKNLGAPLLAEVPRDEVLKTLAIAPSATTDNLKNVNALVRRLQLGTERSIYRAFVVATWTHDCYFFPMGSAVLGRFEGLDAAFMPATIANFCVCKETEIGNAYR